MRFNFSTIRYASWLAVAMVVAGCQPVSQPWAGIPYRSPETQQSTLPPASYSPTTTILPSRAAQSVDTASQDAAIERFLFQRKPDSSR